jgi:hypothetical protein
MPRTVVPTPGKFEWIGRGRSAWCTKAELSGRRRRKGPFLGPQSRGSHCLRTLHRRTVGNTKGQFRNASRHSLLIPSGRGHLTLGMVFFPVGFLDEARWEFQTALAINPTLADPALSAAQGA